MRTIRGSNSKRTLRGPMKPTPEEQRGGQQAQTNQVHIERRTTSQQPWYQPWYTRIPVKRLHLRARVVEDRGTKKRTKGGEWKGKSLEFKQPRNL